MSGLVIDLFAGGGGASVGLEAALGRKVDIAINHDKVALAAHRANHPHTRHLVTDVWDVKPLDATGGKPVDVLWASPDCTHFSLAKGNVPRKQNIRSLAWVVVKWAAEVRPSLIFLENVQEFQGWGPLGEDGRPDKAQMGSTFREWKSQLEALGYVVDYRVLDSSLYGAPTRRRRLFLVARCDGLQLRWPEATHGPGRAPLLTAASCIDWSLPCPSIFERKRPLAEKTLWRVAQGIRRFVFETDRPFVVARDGAEFVPTLVQTGYGERPGQAARVPGLHKPLGTLVDGQKHALVCAFLSKHFGDPTRSDGKGGAVVGSDLRAPVGTVTTRDHHSLTTVKLGRHGSHVADVRAFLTIYYGSDSTGGQTLLEPLRTITARHRLGLVAVSGVDYQITDITLRMLEPHELLRAQFGKFAEGYDLSAATTKAGKVRLIGNSVVPCVAAAVVAANVGTDLARAA